MAFIEFYQNDKKVKKFRTKLSVISETMKHIKIMLTWIHRITFSIFFLMFLIWAYDKSFILIWGYLGLFLGSVHIVSSLSLLIITLFGFKKAKMKLNIMYLTLVGFYFLSWLFVERFNFEGSLNSIKLYLYITPVILASFFTYILEKTNH